MSKRLMPTSVKPSPDDRLIGFRQEIDVGERRRTRLGLEEAREDGRRAHAVAQGGVQRRLDALVAEREHRVFGRRRQIVGCGVGRYALALSWFV